MITVICGAAAFAAIFTGWLIYLVITDKKMKKILKNNEEEQNHEKIN